MVAIRAQSPSFVQILEVARSLRMCCSLVCQSEDKPSLPLQIDGFTHQPARHVTDKLFPGRKDSQVRSSKGRRNAQTLALTCHDIGSELSGRSQNSVGDGLAKACDQQSS